MQTRTVAAKIGRVWPHGSRPGDVQPDGSIRLDPECRRGGAIASGRVWVTIGQAKRAAPFGWQLDPRYTDGYIVAIARQ